VLVAIGGADAGADADAMQTRLVATNGSFWVEGAWQVLEPDYGAKRRQLKPQHVKKIQGMRGGRVHRILGLPF